MRMPRFRNILTMLAAALVTKAALIGIAYYVSVSILSFLGVPDDNHSALIAYAPEVWLSLLALVFGTLIIVVSIASGNTPRLVDMFIGDPLGRLYIWLIMLSCLENIFLQIVATRPSIFFSNLIFMNNFVALPIFVLLAIPYTFSILKYTKNTNVIAYIFRENVQAIHRARKARSSAIEKYQSVLFETVNQLHDLLQYTQFKEPKSDVIGRIGKSVRIYLKFKKQLPDPFFKLNLKIREDISFRTLKERYPMIEREKIFYEQKALKVLDAIYLMLISEGHFELASLCGSELVEIGNTAIRQDDKPVIEAVILSLNTMLRYSINHGLKTREVRNAYNIIYYYNRLVQVFIERMDQERIERCCHYYGAYARELTRLYLSEPRLGILIDSIAWELKKNLIRLCESNAPATLQQSVLDNICSLRPADRRSGDMRLAGRIGLNLIKVSLGLYYMEKNKNDFINELLRSIKEDVHDFHEASLAKVIESDCETLMTESEAFWEETDQGNVNIYYSDNKDQIPRLLEYVRSQYHDYEIAS